MTASIVPGETWNKTEEEARVAKKVDWYYVRKG